MPPPLYAGLPVVALAREAATPELLRDRRRFYPLLAAMERRASELGLVQGGAPGKDRLLGAPPDPLAATALPFYAEAPEAAARALAEAAHQAAPEAEGRYARVEALGGTFRLKAEDRVIGAVRPYPYHRGRPVVAGALGALPRPGEAPWASAPPPTLNVFPAEVQLVGLYAQLCDPGAAQDWAPLLEAEGALRALVPRAPAPPARQAREGVARYLAAVAAEYLPGEGRVALPPPDGGKRGGRYRALSARGLGAESKTLAALARQAGVSVEWAVHVVEVPGVHPRRRLTIYYVPEGGRRVPCLDVYDAARELVPTRTAPVGGHREGTLFVRMEYELVELWTVNFLLRSGELAAGPGGRLVEERLWAFHALAREYERALGGGGRAAAPPAHLLPVATEAYVGRRADPDLEARRAAGPPGAPWFPAKMGGEYTDAGRPAREKVGGA